MLLIYWLAPLAQDASHHQDYHIFRLIDPKLNLHLSHCSWEGGGNPTYIPGILLHDVPPRIRPFNELPFFAMVMASLRAFIGFHVATKPYPK